MVVDHPIFAGVSGHFQPADFQKFYTDEMHDDVVRLMVAEEENFQKEGTEICRINMDDFDNGFTKHMTLKEFFWSKCIGSREPRTGDVYRGTIMMESVYLNYRV